MYTTTKFVRVENDRTITTQTDSDFLFAFQRGVLLSLKEIGTLNEMQLKSAEDILAQQRRASIRGIVQQGGEPP